MMTNQHVTSNHAKRPNTKSRPGAGDKRLSYLRNIRRKLGKPIEYFSPEINVTCPKYSLATLLGPYPSSPHQSR